MFFQNFLEFILLYWITYSQNITSCFSLCECVYISVTICLSHAGCTANYSLGIITLMQFYSRLVEVHTVFQYVHSLTFCLLLFLFLHIFFWLSFSPAQLFQLGEGMNSKLWIREWNIQNQFLNNRLNYVVCFMMERYFSFKICVRLCTSSFRPYTVLCHIFAIVWVGHPNTSIWKSLVSDYFWIKQH